MVRLLHEFERNLQAAFSTGGQLQSALTQAQIEAGLSPTAGHQVIASISSANQMISGALGSSAEGHRLIERLGKSLGYDIVQYGDGIKNPAPGFFFEANDGAFGVAA